MKKIFILSLFVVLLTGSGCRKFLEVAPVDQLTGNVMWASKDNVVAYSLGIYSQIRDLTFKKCNFFPAVGDLRMAPTHMLDAGSYRYIGDLSNNDLRSVVNPSNWSAGNPNFLEITKWNDWYKIIQSANIMYDEVGRSKGFSDADKQFYQAEAVFQRCFAYFFMVRIYGDVPYVTAAYNILPLARTNMVDVLKNCIADMGAVEKKLPWTSDDPGLKANRAMRGGALVLMMHMNMWLAGFDQSNKATYYQATIDLANELLTENGGAYELLPIKNFHDIFKGNSKESLFTIPQNPNLGDGESFVRNYTFSKLVLRWPLMQKNNRTLFYYDRKFLDALYPAGVVDQRKDLWFDESIYNTTNQEKLSFMFKKFSNMYTVPNDDSYSYDAMTVFRLPDVYLLKAEAEAESGKDASANADLKIVRDRAGVPATTLAGSDLKDAIFYERCKEFMGEGQYFFDLVRTRRILDAKSLFGLAPVSQQAFDKGAWTWPITLTNPGVDGGIVKGNTYWN